MLATRSYCLAGVFWAALGCAGAAASPEGDKASSSPRTSQAWTLPEAMGQLQLYPDDVYLQFIALQLARNESPAAATRTAGEIESRRWQNNRGGRPDRRVDLFDLFAGALAVQESLQLDAMRGAAARVPPRGNTVQLKDLQGPGIKSHPWGKMLAAQAVGGKKAQVSPLALCVPEDQYYVEFRSLTKLMEIAEAGDLWGAHLMSQSARESQSQQTSPRLKSQLAMQTDPLTRPFYDMVVQQVAMTGSDLYFREGTDVTLVFTIKQPEVFRMRMDGFLEAARKSHPDAVRSTGTIHGVEYVSVATPDRAVSAYSAYPRPDLHVRSNSKAALERVLGVVTGKSGMGRLGDTEEFKYIRTLMVAGDPREDGLVYLSDPFIRRLVGPQTKLTERRRMICYNHMRMIGHAAMLYRTQFGRTPKSLDELIEGRCLPDAFTAARTPKEGEPLACPSGGTYSLSADGTRGVCSHHGHSGELIPCIEVPTSLITAREADEYRQFLAEYNQYWRTYFDPIAIRIQVAPKQYRVETIILPLIDNSIYTGMAQVLGGEPEPLDALPVPKRNIFSAVVRLNKDAIVKNDFRAVLPPYRDLREADERNLVDLVNKGFGNQIGLHVYDGPQTFDLNLTGFLGEAMGRFRGGVGRLGDEMLVASFLVASLNSPVYAAIPVKDPAVVDKWMAHYDKMLAAHAQWREGGFIPLSFDFYKLPGNDGQPKVRCFGVSLGPVKWRMFFARIGRGFYVASKRFILDDLAALEARPASPAGDRGPEAHAMVRIRPQHWQQVLSDYRLGWEENSRQACLANLGPLSAVARADAAVNGGRVDPKAVERQAAALHATTYYCPDGGKYEASADGREVACSLHGTKAAPRQSTAPAPDSATARVFGDFAGATAALTFLEDGLHAVVTIDRK